MSLNIEKFWSARPTDKEAMTLLRCSDDYSLIELSKAICDDGYGDMMTYSPKVFIPLTVLCRDMCHYCTFARKPKEIQKGFLQPDEVFHISELGKKAGCYEALFTLGDKPELRYRSAREELEQLGYKSTFEYLLDLAHKVAEDYQLLPHINAGVLTKDQMAALREVSASQGIMLESSSERLCIKGGPHYGSPDKRPQVRLKNIEEAGMLSIPFTTGILIGIGETRAERIDSLLRIRQLNDRYKHIQELIIQPFRAKARTLMAGHSEPPSQDLMWTIAVARILFGGSMSIQAPPNLWPGGEGELISAGINDWGGISPVTPDHVNPEAPWPKVVELENKVRLAGKTLVPRLPIYPDYLQHNLNWLSSKIFRLAQRFVDAEGFPRTDRWIPGEVLKAPFEISGNVGQASRSTLSLIFDRVVKGIDLLEGDVVKLFGARGNEFFEVCKFADELRRQVNGDTVTYVVNRNINYTNICTYRCGFCAFSKSTAHNESKDKPYLIDLEEIRRRVREAWERGATEVCLQGGIHPSFDGNTYLSICREIRTEIPEINIHAFSPLEVTHGASTMNLTISEFLETLKDVGLSSLPGTAAEILHDDIRKIICPDKLTTQEWLNVIKVAHSVGLSSTATIMFGHVDKPQHWARHLITIRDLQSETGGFTEFVPLPFIHKEAPMYNRQGCRRGPTFRESILMHAVARIVLYGRVHNIQASWTKMGKSGLRECLKAGVNDVGGTLMNESISRAAGNKNGQELPPEEMDALIEHAGRIPQQRTTKYGKPDRYRSSISYNAPVLRPLPQQSGKIRESDLITHV